MARLIWTEPALTDLQIIAEYIALDKPDAAQRFVQKAFAAVERLADFPNSGAKPPEIPVFPYRQLSVPPCRIFYRVENDVVFIVYVMRGERELRVEDLEERDPA